MKGNEPKANNDCGTESKVDLTTDDVFSLLSNSRRRSLLLCLYERGPTDRGEVIESVAQGEGDDQLTDAQLDSVRVSLYQCHEPKLVDHGVIETDGDALELGPNADELISHLREDSLLSKLRSLF